jgi:hypothetical protein
VRFGGFFEGAFGFPEQPLGKGYTGIMADVLDYAADNPEILSRVHG